MRVPALTAWDATAALGGRFATNIRHSRRARSRSFTTAPTRASRRVMLFDLATLAPRGMQIRCFGDRRGEIAVCRTTGKAMALAPGGGANELRATRDPTGGSWELYGPHFCS